MSGEEPNTGTAGSPKLRRVLTLKDLVLYGIIVVSPVGAMVIFGVVSQRGRGHAAASVLLAILPILLTAISYGRMAREYPSAGSAFTYVGREISPALGYVTGWCMTMDYLLIPVLSVIWCGQQAHVFIPAVPYDAWALFFAVAITSVNAQGVKISARVNLVLAAGMGLVVFLFFGAAIHYIIVHPHSEGGFYTRPFYDPGSWTAAAMFGGTSLAILNYIGFDGISTLAEEAKNPRRNVLLATVLTCLIIGIFSTLQVYAAELVWPQARGYPNVDTAFTFVAQRAWSPLFAIVGLTLIVANFGTSLAGQMGAARLLYGMGRSGALPNAVFGVVNPKSRVPRINVLIVGVVAVAGALVLPLLAGGASGYELGANLLNFGALLAFMGVNIAALVRYYIRAEHKRTLSALAPIGGFAVCLLLWLHLSAQAKEFGFGWMGVGVLVGAWRTRGFRADLMTLAFPSEPME